MRCEGLGNINQKKSYVYTNRTTLCDGGIGACDQC